MHFWKQGWILYKEHTKYIISLQLSPSISLIENSVPDSLKLGKIHDFQDVYKVQYHIVKVYI